jgi:LAO/AO transport system kinase
VQTVATKGEGFDDLWTAVGKHRAFQEERGLLEARRHRRIEREIKEIVAERYRRRIDTEGAEELARLTQDVLERRCNPYQAADRLIEAL